MTKNTQPIASAKKSYIISLIIKILVISICVLFMIFVIWKIIRYTVLQQDDIAWPPIINKCPDYWNYENGVCQNVYKKEEDPAPDTVQPIPENVTNEKLIELCNWTNQYTVPWDGIDNLC